MLRILLAAVAMLLLAVSSGRAEAVRQLDWESLIPPAPQMEKPFDHLTAEQLYDLEALVQIRAMEKRGEINQVDPLYEEGVEIAHRLAEQGLDVDRLVERHGELMARYAELERAVVPELDGQLVRIPGYALPLELDAAGVEEFLLVPYIGACIHVPPPPANQIVLVKLNQTYKADELFEPVWITGRMRVQPANASLYLVDGAASVEAAYVLEGVRVEPYEQ